MQLFEIIGITASDATIDWELTPAETFADFESWGGSRRVRDKNERFYYFYVDGWQDPPEVRLMERGIKHARFMARIDAPRELIAACLAEQGKDVATNNKCYAINAQLRLWLTEHLLDACDPALITPLVALGNAGPTATGLPARGDIRFAGPVMALPKLPAPASDADVAALVMAGGFFDCDRNPAGGFPSSFIDNQDSLTVTDLATGLTWQRGGYGEINTFLRLQHYCRTMNEEQLAGFADWRLPTLAEAMTLLRPGKNTAGLHLPSFFSPCQTFIFCAEARKPGGQWFVDFNLGRVFWASSSNPGGYGRLVRKSS